MFSVIASKAGLAIIYVISCDLKVKILITAFLNENPIIFTFIFIIKALKTILNSICGHLCE